MILAVDVLVLVCVGVPVGIWLVLLLNLGYATHGVDREKEESSKNPHPGQPDD